MRPTIEIPSELFLRLWDRALAASRLTDVKDAKLADDARLYVAIAKQPLFHIEGRRWHGDMYGNTYHSVRVLKNGEKLFTIPFAYGYGDMYLQTALDTLQSTGQIPPCPEGHNHQSTRYLREVLHSTCEVIDVPRKKDLHSEGKRT